MADYLAITSTQIQPEAPLTSYLAGQWTNNVLAIIEGAVGAPRIQTGALDDDVVTLDKLASPTAGTTYTLWQYYIDTEIQITNITSYPGYNGYAWRETSTTQVHAYIIVPGTITASIDHRDGAGTSFVRILKNGVQEAEWSNTTGATVTRTTNITVVAGDVITWQQRTSGGGSDVSFMENLAIKSGTNTVCAI